MSQEERQKEEEEVMIPDLYGDGEPMPFVKDRVYHTLEEAEKAFLTKKKD